MTEPIPVIWLSLHDGVDSRGPWDTRVLEALFDGSLWPHGLTFEHHVGIGTYPTINHMGAESTKHGPAIVVIPARHHCSPDDIVAINGTLAAWTSVLLILVGDEEGQFPWRDIVHDSIRFWVQMPDPNHYADMAGFGFFFGNGWGAATPELIDDGWPENDAKDIMWSFSGQVTHPRRKQAANGLQKARSRVYGRLRPTKGFAQGMPAEQYAAELAHTWVAPCPSGPESPDCFRVYEALEAGCIPIVDAETPHGPTSYWDFVYGWVPFPRIIDWDTVGGVIESCLADRHRLAAACSAWWQGQKSKMVQRLLDDLGELGVPMPEQPKAQALVVTSPVASNPDLTMIRDTIASVEDSIGEVDILIACDGVRPEQQDRTPAYDEFLYRLTCWTRCKPNVLPYIVHQWWHQACLARLALDCVTAPTLLFMEHDTPLVTDEPIDWPEIIDLVANSHMDIVRFHHESHVLPVHEYLMVDHQTKTMLGVPLRRTRQWSQRPHLANADYYRRILRANFPWTARTMIEDKMHSVVQSEPGHRLAIYHPEGNIKRSYHLDGRGDDPKFDMEFE